MSDLGPDVQLAATRIRAAIQRQRFEIENAHVRIMEAISSIKQAYVNINAAEKEIARQETNMMALEQEHGKFSVTDVLNWTKSLNIEIEGTTNG